MTILHEEVVTARPLKVLAECLKMKVELDVHVLFDWQGATYNEYIPRSTTLNVKCSLCEGSKNMNG
jgi:hypothetical protein